VRGGEAPGRCHHSSGARSRPLLHPVVPCPPGGGVDVIARSLQEPLAKALGPSVAVDNRGAAANRPYFALTSAVDATGPNSADAA
jgi:hypothetical protein